MRRQQILDSYGELFRVLRAEIDAKGASGAAYAKEAVVSSRRVKLRPLSLHSAKGIEWDLVYAVELENLPWTKDELRQSEAALRVAVTARATASSAWRRGRRRSSGCCDASWEQRLGRRERREPEPRLLPL